MKKWFAFFTLIFLLTAVKGHDFKIAHYTIHQIGHELYCDISIDLDDFKSVLQVPLDQQDMNSYLNQHLTFLFNGDSVAFSQVEHLITGHWLKCRIKLETAIMEPTRVEVFNDLLLKEIDHHDNLMRFLFHDRTRVFRLNKKRHQISFSY